MRILLLLLFLPIYVFGFTTKDKTFITTNTVWKNDSIVLEDTLWISGSLSIRNCKIFMKNCPIIIVENGANLGKVTLVR